ncbi:MAG: DNA polymerase III subunit delta' [Actinomycetia bacterium]|nr:DNA polymerase III subunit delta' [Actinomycetes bacterium]
MASAEVIAPFDEMVGQSLAARYFSRLSVGKKHSQAYLFCGPASADKEHAALVYARSLLCPTGGNDGSGCNDCRQVMRGSHPDLRILKPEGANAYLAEQIRELIHDSTLSPYRSQHKVYVLEDAERLSASAANAFLKVLEEPAKSVVFILIAKSPEAVLPTLRSRCQLIPFRALSDRESLAYLMARVPVDEREARYALALSANSLDAAAAFLASSSQRKLRQEVLAQLVSLDRYDVLDILNAARQMVIACKAPLDELRLQQAEQLAASQETLGRGALTALEQRQKRELSAAERDKVLLALSQVRSWLRDILLVVLDMPESCVNYDVAASVQAVAARLLGRQGAAEQAAARADVLPSISHCLQAVDKATDVLNYNVSVQSVFESLLITLSEELQRS